MDASNLKSWYDDLGLCMMDEKTYAPNATYWTMLENCKKVHGNGKYGDAFYSLPSSAFANKVRGCCCTEDVPTKDRGFDWVLKGHEDGKTKVVSNIFKQFSKQNMSIIFIGDSMNNQVFAAFQQELLRENTPGKLELNALHQRPWFHDAKIHEKMGLNRKVFGYLPDSYSWTPIDPETNKEMNTVFVYSVCIWYFNNIHEEVLVKNVIMPQLALRDHPSGVAIFANIGHHLANERSNPNKTPLYNHMSSFLNWLHDLTIFNPHNVAFFRETTPSHFNSPDKDGSYEKWHTSPNSQYNYLEPTVWDKTLYYCKPIENYTDASKQIPENDAVKSLLTAWGTEHTHVHYFSLFQQLAPFYTLKYGHCGGWNRIDIIDCVHYCSWAPPMWIGVWDEMLKQIKPALKQRNTILQEKSYNKEKVYQQDEAFPKFDEIVIADLKVITSSDDDAATLYLLYHGLKRPIQDNDLKKTLQPHFKKLDISTIKIEKVDEEELNKIPTGDVIAKAAGDLPDNTLVKLDSKHAPEIFVMEDGKKRSIPDWSTFVAMHFELGKVVHMPQEKFDAIEVGSPLPHKD